MRTSRTYSSAETKIIAARLAARLLAEGPKTAPRAHAAVIALQGDLGAGKTTFTQGFLKALGVRGRVTSPTFVLMKRFLLSARVRKSGFVRAYHIDAYRFHTREEADTLGLKEIFEDPKAIMLVEWPERLKGLLPRARVSVRFRHGKGPDERVIIGT